MNFKIKDLPCVIVYSNTANHGASNYVVLISLFNFLTEFFYDWRKFILFSKERIQYMPVTSFRKKTHKQVVRSPEK